MSEFKSALTNAYTVAVVRDRRGPLGGGLYQLAIEFLSRLSLSDVARILVEGATYDLIKSGTDPFFIRAFIEAYKRFKNRPKNERVDIERLRFVFQDSAITIERLPNTDLVAELRPILEAVAEHFESIIAGSDGQLFEIYIPVFEDTSEERVCKYRTLLSTDETPDMRQISRSDYFKPWGLQYYADGSQPRVYDVEQRVVIKENFYTESQYRTRSS